MFTPTTTPTTYEDMNASRSSYQEARITYQRTYFNFLSTILEELGFRNKLVQLKESGLRGQFQVSETPYLTQPWEIKFYPCKKSDGDISMKSKYLVKFRPWDEKTLLEQLKGLAEVVGDLP